MELFKNIRLNNGRSMLKRRSASVKRSGDSFNFIRAVRIGVLWDASDESGYQAVSAFMKKMSETGKRVEVLAWIPGKEVSDRLTGLSYMKFLRPQDLNFSFVPTSSDAKAFMEKKFDLLIDINPSRVFPLIYIVSLSSSPMKVGIDVNSSKEDTPYDFMIQSGKVTDTAAFLDQAVHYLSLINSSVKS